MVSGRKEFSVGKTDEKRFFSYTRRKVIHSLGGLSTGWGAAAVTCPLKNAFFVDKCRVEGELSTGYPQCVDKK